MNLFRYLSVFIFFFILGCSSKHDILNSSLERSGIKISTLQKKELELKYKENYDFWNKYPRQIDIFIKNNFSKEALAFRKKYIGRNIEDVTKTIKYEKIDIKTRGDFKIYDFVSAMEVYSFKVKNKIVENLYIYDMI